jgi:hypothetical protein
MLVPVKTLGAGDGVDAMSRSILSHAPRQRVIRLDAWCEHLRNVLTHAPIPDAVILVLFAHPAPHMTGFAVNRAPNGVRDVLLLGWWQDPNITFEILVAHVCNGAGILRDQAWKTVFPHWVSYDNFIYAFYGTTGADARWARVLDATIDAGVDGGSLRNVADRIRFAYIREMLDIDDAGDAADGDALNFMYFQNALDALATSEDRT